MKPAGQEEQQGKNPENLGVNPDHFFTAASFTNAQWHQRSYKDETDTFLWKQLSSSMKGNMFGMQRI